MVKDNAQKTEYYYDNAGTRWWKKDSTGYVIYTGGTGNRLDSWKLLHTTDFLSLRTLRIQGHANKTIGRDNRWGQLYVSNSVAVTPEISGSNFWVDAMTVGLGTQQVVAAIRDQAGNTGYATNEFFITVVTNGYYHYTAAGCLDYIAYTGEEYSSGVSLKWNSQYQLTNAYQSSSFNIRYLYDALGRRVSRFVVPATTPSGGEPLDEEHYVYEGDQVVADLGKNGKVLRSYVWGAG